MFYKTIVIDYILLYFFTAVYLKYFNELNSSHFSNMSNKKKNFFIVIDIDQSEQCFSYWF